MFKKIKVSICMATYNGEHYLPLQIESILSQMRKDDELIVVDDASVDGTVAYLKSIRDYRLRLFTNDYNIGHVQSFAKAINLAQGKYILMADQDDVWIDGRLDIMYQTLSSGCLALSTNTKFIDSQGLPIPAPYPELIENDSNRNLTNIIRIFTGKAYYFGCAMGIREEFRRLILPIPKYVESHDLWIAMAANIVRSNKHINNYTLERRCHGSNASIVKRPLLRKIKSRIIFLLSLIHISLRLLKVKANNK